MINKDNKCKVNYKRYTTFHEDIKKHFKMQQNVFKYVPESIDEDKKCWMKTETCSPNTQDSMIKVDVSMNKYL